MTTLSFTSTIIGTVQMPNVIAVYMYSPFPVIVRSAKLDTVALTLTNTMTGASHSETRSLYDGKAEFDIARVVQLLAPDVDEVFRMNLSQDGEAAPYATMKLELATTSGENLLARSLFVLYGALDQTEERFGKQSRRVFVNYPQTIQIWKDSSDEMAINGEYIDADFYPALSLFPTASEMVEMNLMLHFWEAPGQALRAALVSGKPADIFVTCRFGGVDILSSRDHYGLKLLPDLTPRGTGTFLRWLHRDGTFGYWHFACGTSTTGAASRTAFMRRIEGNPAESVNGAYRNSVKADFTESRQIGLGTRCNSQEEHDYLCGLVTSPVVERLIEVDGADKWQRVNVVPGSYTRSMRFDAPSIQPFELAIELPPRNTVSL